MAQPPSAVAPRRPSETTHLMAEQWSEDMRGSQTPVFVRSAMAPEPAPTPPPPPPPPPPEPMMSPPLPLDAHGRVPMSVAAPEPGPAAVSVTSPLIPRRPDGTPVDGNNNAADDGRRAGYRPYLCYLIFASCLAGFLYEMALNKWKLEPLERNPMVGPGIQALIDAGAKDTPRIVNDGEWWRLFSPMVLHAGVVHLLLNMSLVYRFGLDFERDIGAVRLFIIYVPAGVASTVVSGVFLPHQVTVGASGSIFGMIGAFWAELLQNWHDMGDCRQLMCLAFSTVLNLAIGLLPFVDNFAHFFGFLSGFLLGTAVLIRPGVKGARTRRNAIVCRQLVIAVVCTTLFVIGTIAAFIALYTKVNTSSCGWCHYLSCVPTSYWSCDIPEPVPSPAPSPSPTPVLL